MQIYAWDFTFADGDTIREKAKSLYEILRTLCFQKNGSYPATVICNEELASFLFCYASIEEKDSINFKYEDGLVCEIKKSCGSNGYQTDFNLYENKNQVKDEILVRVGDKPYKNGCVSPGVKSVVKIFNYPM